MTPRVPVPVNEPNLSYLPGSPERAALKSALKEMSSEQIDIPIIIGGKEIRTGRTERTVMPHDHQHVLAEWHVADAVARPAGDRRGQRRAEGVGVAGRWQDRAAVFLRAAELLTTTWRATLNAATMLGQSKTAFQAEIDSASELIDFWRFNPAYAEELYRRAAAEHPRGVESARIPAARGIRLRGDAVQLHVDRRQPADRAGADGQHRGLEAGVERDAERLLHHAAARGGGHAAGRHQLRPWRRRSRSPTSCSTHRISPASISRAAPASSTRCGRRSARTPDAIARTRAWSAKPAARTSSSRTRRPTSQELAVAIARGGFEFQGQKCSAASRVYVPQSLWPDVRDRVVAMMREMRMGDVQDFRTFIGAVIDRKSFTKISGYLTMRRTNATIIQGGTADDEQGFFVEPTLVETKDPGYRLLCEEIFGPVVTAYVYPDAQWADTLALVDRTSPYALTGAVFARDRRAIRRGDDGAAERRRQLLHQRQADRRGGRPAAVRRREGVGHERQGRVEVEPGPVGERPDDQGDVLAAARLPVRVYDEE